MGDGRRGIRGLHGADSAGGRPIRKADWWQMVMSGNWALGMMACTGMLALGCLPGQAGNLVVLGDSLSAEYESVPDFPGVENPTAYAAVTRAGWESMSWTEILGRLRPAQLNLGEHRSSLIGWGDLRFSGYERNFAVPGFTAGEWERIANSSLFSDIQYLPYRQTLADVLREEADQVVVWLGANEFRGEYGRLYDGADPTPLIDGLRRDVAEVLDFVLGQRPGLEVVVVTIPDLGFSPDKALAHPELTGQARVTEATVRANEVIREEALALGAAVADVFAEMDRVVQEGVVYFGAVDIKPGLHAENDPRYWFTRDGLHPNTAPQLVIARLIVDTFNEAFGSAIPRIGDAEALELLGLDPDLPYWEWAEARGLERMMPDEDADLDGWLNVVEYGFGMDPSEHDAPETSWRATSEGLELRAGTSGERFRHVRLVVETSADLATWAMLPAEGLVVEPDGTQVLNLARVSGPVFVRLGVAFRSPE